MASNLANREVVLTLQDAVLGHAGRGILPPVNVRIARGDAWALVGRNGAGKSTLLKTLVGAIPPVSGTVRWSGGARVGWVPQRSTMDTAVPMRVVDVVRGGVDRGMSFMRPWYTAEQRRCVQKALELSGASPLSRQRYTELSEGQKQRVMVARALAGEPDVLLLDEPTSAMDPMSEEATFSFLEALRSDMGLTIMVASHHPQIVPALADRALYFDRDDQQVVAGAVADVLGSPAFLARYGNTSCVHGSWDVSA